MIVVSSPKDVVTGEGDVEAPDERGTDVLVVDPPCADEDEDEDVSLPDVVEPLAGDVDTLDVVVLLCPLGVVSGTKVPEATVVVESVVDVDKPVFPVVGVVARVDPVGTGVVPIPEAPVVAVDDDVVVVIVGVLEPYVTV
jgi:hypothetical protein